VSDQLYAPATLYPRGNTSRYTLDRRLDGPQSAIQTSQGACRTGIKVLISRRHNAVPLQLNINTTLKEFVSIINKSHQVVAVY